MTVSSIRADLEAALHERTAAFPRKNPAQMQLIYDLTTQYLRALLENNKPAKLSQSKSTHTRPRPIFIGGPMKSGTTLLVNLLDNHPDLLVLPGDSLLLSWLSGTNQSYLRYISWSMYEGKLFGSDVHWLQRLINPTGQPPFFVLGTENNYAKLASAMHALSQQEDVTPQMFLDMVISTLAAIRDKHPTYWVAKTPGNEFNLKHLREYFPELIIIHVLRNPLFILNSQRKLYTHRRWQWSIFKRSRRISRSFKLARHMSSSNRYFRVDYEDLVTQHEATMKKLASFLHIPYKTTLTKPSVFGRDATANSMTKNRRTTGTLAPLQPPSAIELPWYESLVARFVLRDTL